MLVEIVFCVIDFVVLRINIMLVLGSCIFVLYDMDSVLLLKFMICINVIGRVVFIKFDILLFVFEKLVVKSVLL